MIIVNTPHNPVGKVFTRTELELIAALAEEFNILVMADEVVRPELLAMLGITSTPLFASTTAWSSTTRNIFALPHFPGCGSALSLLDPPEASSPLPPREYLLTSRLESFAATGWRVGWLIGPSSIINPTLAASTRIVFCTNSPLQEAAAAGLEQAVERRFFETQLKEYQERRDKFVSVFDRLGVTYTLPEGTYFVLMVRPSSPSHDHPVNFFLSQDTSSVKIPDDYPFPESVSGRGRDFR